MLKDEHFKNVFASLRENEDKHFVRGVDASSTLTDVKGLWTTVNNISKGHTTFSGSPNDAARDCLGECAKQIENTIDSPRNKSTLGL